MEALFGGSRSRAVHARAGNSERLAADGRGVTIITVFAMPPGWFQLEAFRTHTNCVVGACFNDATGDYGIIPFFDGAYATRASPIRFSREYDRITTPALIRFAYGNYGDWAQQREANDTTVRDPGKMPRLWKTLEARQTSRGCWIAFCFDVRKLDYGIVPFWEVAGAKRHGAAIRFGSAFEVATTPALVRFAYGDYDIAELRKRYARTERSEREKAPVRQILDPDYARHREEALKKVAVDGELRFPRQNYKDDT